MNFSKAYYRHLLFAITESDIGDTEDHAEAILDTYHAVAQDYFAEQYSREDYSNHVTLNGAVNELALALVQVLHFDYTEEAEATAKSKFESAVEALTE